MNVHELLEKIPEYQRKAEQHDYITAKILEIVAEIDEKLTEILELLKKR